MTSKQLATRLKEIRERGPQTRTATLARHGIDTEARTVELAFSSETDTVKRWFGIEILGHDAGEVDLSRLANAAPVLWDHDWKDQRGVVETARIDGDRVGRAVVRFSRSTEGEKLFQDIVDGIVTKVSVGYSVEGLEHLGQRDGVDAYRATAWTPLEISMVSVPADDTVGVGRTPEISPHEDAALCRNVPQIAMQGTSKPMSEIQGLFARANKELGFLNHYDGHGNLLHQQKKPAASVGHFSLREMEVPSFAASPLRVVHTPLGTEAGKRTKLSDVVLAGSRCVAAGAHLAIVPAAIEPAASSEAVVLYRRSNMGFTAIEAGEFAVVPDGTDVTTSANAIYRALVDLETMPTLGIRVDLSRAEQKSYQDGELADATTASIALGLARAVDATLLAAIAASTPGAFSLASTAAAGFEFAELRALVGTDATGAAVGQDGMLRAAGVLAELTPDAAATIVGAFNRACIAVHEEITLIAERINVSGRMTLTAWVNMQALLPLPGAFWTVGA